MPPARMLRPRRQERRQPKCASLLLNKRASLTQLALLKARGLHIKMNVSKQSINTMPKRFMICIVEIVEAIPEPKKWSRVMSFGFENDRLSTEIPAALQHRLATSFEWRVDQALKASNELANFNLTWLEEPITPDDYRGYAYLKNNGATPIAAGENLHTLKEFQELFYNNGVDFPEPDYTTCGGFTPFMKIAKLAEAYNLPIMSHGAHDVHIQLLAACPNTAYIEVHAFGIEDYITNPLKIENGYGIAPDLPGIGFEFDLEKLKKYKTN